MILTDDRLFSSNIDEPCFSLQRTNVRLSGNIKIVVDEDAAFLESISSNSYLSQQDFKGFPISFDRRHDSNIASFASKASNMSYWFDVAHSSTLDSKGYDSQYSQQYEWGAYSEANSIINKKFRFFAPLWVNSSIPTHFLIFRTDRTEYQDLGTYFKRGTLVKSFNLSTTKIGKYLRSYVNDKDFKRWPMRFRFDGETDYFGISLTRGTMTIHKENSIDSYLANERTITEQNSEITNGWSRGQMICHQLLNMEFAFDDGAAPYGFNNYVGVYVNANEIDLTTALGIHALSIETNRVPILLNTNELVTKLFDQNSILEPYKVTVGTNLIVDSNQSLPPHVMIDLKTNPDRNSKIIIKYNDVVEMEVKIAESDISQNLEQTRLNIVAAINNKSFTSTNISVRSFIYYDDVKKRNLIVIQSIQTSIALEEIKIKVPRGLSIVKPEYKLTQPNSDFHNFVGVGLNDVMLQSKASIADVDYVVVSNVEYVPVHYYEYMGIKVLRLSGFSNESQLINHSIRFLENRTSKILSTELITHRDFDFSTHDHYYNDILDFDLELFKKYLIDEIDSPSYIGAWEETSDVELSDYRTEVRESVERFFAPIKQQSNFLIKDIDLTTLEAASTVDNEFDRFIENQIIALYQKNRLDAFVCKWGHLDGTNTYSQPYGLNMNMAFRFDNFSPHHKTNSRNLANHTHSWFLIGEGSNPYSDKVHVQMSYSNEQMSINGLLSILNDEYDKLVCRIDDTEKTWYNKSPWSRVHKREGTNDIFDIFFRGVQFSIQGSYTGYRFAAVLLGRHDGTELESDRDLVELVDNAKYKTLTLVIKFKMPDPILTSLERGDSSYYLDRSLMYYVTDVLQTAFSTDTFGVQKISLNLYDTVLPKSIDDVDTNASWHTEFNGSKAFWVGRGDSTVFSTGFGDLLSIGGDFSWRSVKLSPSGEELITKITATDIVFIGDDYFWCRDIKMEMYTGVTRYLNAEYFGWTGEGTLLDKDNEWYISKAVSYYNSIYDTIVKSSANIKRYKRIAFSSLMNILNNTQIRYSVATTDGTVVVSEKKLQPIEPTYTYTISSLTVVDNELTQAEKRVAYPISRYNGYYGPIFKDLHLPLNSALGKNMFIGDINTSIRYIKKIGRDGFDVNVDQYNESYLRNIYSLDLYKLYEHEDTHVEVSSLINREEWRSLVSSVFNYTDRLEASYSTSTNRLVNLIDVLMKHMFEIVFTNETLAEEQKINALKLQYDLTITNIDNFDERRAMFSGFYFSFFSKHFRVSSITTSGVNLNFKYINDSDIELESDQTDLTIVFERQ